MNLPSYRSIFRLTKVVELQQFQSHVSMIKYLCYLLNCWSDSSVSLFQVLSVQIEMLLPRKGTDREISQEMPFLRKLERT